MEHIGIILKLIIGLISGIVSWLIGGLGLVFTVLLALQMIDFITGLMVGIYEKNINSRIGTKGLIRKTYVILLIGAVYMVESAMLGSHGIITDGISASFCLVEFVSIVENGGKMGVPLPDKVKNLILVLKNKDKSEVE
ncbi:phage holin family protein [Paenibacillus sp. 19GGS1-52]|uniref:phage holin family protein n=1 Tax=Paenibacillus sp. 19GGS1-52 TaxID=2758563 RepID=UPI001EFA9BBD|nr:phage holin family protein [Paenibacillus sp. 19GGS1-52]ULO09685.1 phage holin family protein [Paenibacillus sp. 19GGS1-52]